MQWNGIKIPVVILALGIGLAVLFGGQSLFNRYSLEQPLTILLEENKNVAAFKINKDRPKLELEVQFGPVENFQESYKELEESVRELAGSREFTIILKDNRDQTLDRLGYYARLAAYQAARQGNYLEMEGYIAGLAAEEGAAAMIYLDRDNIYLQINHGDYYFYEIIPLAPAGGAGLPTAKGGGSLG